MMGEKKNKQKNTQLDFQPPTVLRQLGFVQMWGYHRSNKMLQVLAVVLATVLLYWVLHALICFYFC